VSAHTPGPWSVCHNSWETSSVYTKGFCIAECPIAQEAEEDNQAHWEAIKEANARLIAAAPELLEALIETLDALECWTSTDVRIAQARAAIAKATQP
jgi:hypothetical protein